ncbi:MAG: response regulator, partial [bacterium]|nr:response regulator [bacterium]
TYHELGNYPRALEYFFISLKVSEELGAKRGISQAHLSIGQHYVQRDETKKGIDHLTQALTLAQATNKTSTIKEAAADLSQTYAKMKQFDKAYQYHVLFKEKSDELKNKERDKKITELAMQYEFDKKQRQQQMEQEKKDLANVAELKRQQLLKYFFSGFGVLLALVFFGGFRLKTKANRRLNLEIDERKQAQQKLGESEKKYRETAEKLKEMDQVKSRFFANISHEFRTPLTLIMGPLEQMLSSGPGENHREDLHMALRNSQRLLNLINQLLDLSKLESGRMTLQASKQNVIHFLKGVSGSFESLVIKMKLDLTFHSDLQDIPLYFEAVKLEQVIVNLIANAVKFTPAGGKIAVTAVVHDKKGEGYPSGYLQISVSDTGVGIPSDQLPFIFDRFYQADGYFSHQHKHKGSGIGLALAKELVTLHHGNIEVTSREGKGSGTEFTIRLPLGKDHLKPGDIIEDDLPALAYESKAAVAEEFEIQNSAQETKEKHMETMTNGRDVILVVEDNPDVRKFIRGPLEAKYTVIEASDGEEGIQKARKVIPDLIISDVMMPRKDGYQLCQTLKTDIKTSHIPIVLLTAKASEGSVMEGLETGADDYITKPFNTQILLTRIGNLIGLRRQLQETIRREMMLRPTEIAVSSIDREFMKELKEALEKNIPDMEFGVDQLAEHLYMSRATLNRKIKALTGESTNQFIQSYRLKRAAQLLKANFGNVTEVAFEVGFSSSNYFTRCFKEKFHQLPHTFQASEATVEKKETTKM